VLTGGVMLGSTRPPLRNGVGSRQTTPTVKPAISVPNGKPLSKFSTKGTDVDNWRRGGARIGAARR
jgi:hypothetical protein